MERQKIKVLDNDYAIMWVYPGFHLVHHKFKKFMFGDALRQTLMKGAEVFVEYNCNRWLSDDRQNLALTEADRIWAINEWEPRVLKAGWKYWALVLPENILGKIKMSEIAGRYIELGLSVKIFSDYDKAYTWITEQ